MELTEGLLKRNGFDIHYWLGGKPNAPLVIFTHGATLDHHEWDNTLPLVAQHFQVLAWDMRGHGQSRPAKFSVADSVQDLIDLLDALQVEQAILVGHSLGGNLHQEVVFYHPEQVQALVFLDCTWNFQRLTLMDKLLLLIARPIFKLYPHKMLVDQAVRISARQKTAQKVMRTAMQQLSKEEFVHIMLTMTACLHYEPGYRIHKPVLMMMGDQENTGNIRQVMPQWAKLEPDCRFVIIPNAKHSANLDNPDAFHKHLMEFLFSLDMRRETIDAPAA